VFRSTLMVAVATAMICTGALASGSPNQVNTNILKNQPIAFTENRGQWDESVRFRADVGDATMWFTSDGVYYQFTRHIPKGDVLQHERLSMPYERADHSPYSIEQLVIKASFVDANPNPEICGDKMLEHKCNYFLGDDPSKWHTDVSNYKAIAFRDIYIGIDLQYFGNGERMEYEFIVEPGADPSQIVVEYNGSECMSVSDNGNLVVETEWGTFYELRPFIYQVDGNERDVVHGRYVMLTENMFGFALGDDYDPDLVLVIDPEISFSTYLGGALDERGEAIAVDDSGQVYVVGQTLSSDFPTQDPYQIDQTGVDIFVTKFNPAGSGLIYSTYIGGGGTDIGYGIDLGDGCAFITGSTASADYPTQFEYQVDQPGTDAFVTRLANNGNWLDFSTYLGGSAADYGKSIAYESSGEIFVTGHTSSTDFPLQNPFQTDQPSEDVFVSSFGSDGSFHRSTYLGGSLFEYGYDITVDDSMCVYVTGQTASLNFPLENPYQSSLAGGVYDAFVAKFDFSLSNLIYSTYLGGSSDDHAYSIAVDHQGNAYVTGTTDSPDFPVQQFAGFLQDDQPSTDAFVTRLNPSGDNIDYSLYLGGDGEDVGFGVAVDAGQMPYVTGRTNSTDFPTTDPLEDNPPGSDAFVTVILGDGSCMFYSTYLGGDAWDSGLDIASDDENNLYITGFTNSSDYPVDNPYQTDQAYMDAFVTKITLSEYMLAVRPNWGYPGDDLTLTVYGFFTEFGGTDSTLVDLRGPSSVARTFDSDVFGPQMLEAQITLKNSYTGSDLEPGYYDLWVEDWQLVQWWTVHDLFEVRQRPNVCGDADASGTVDIDDVVYLISYIFGGGPEPNPVASGEVDCSGAIDIDDVVYLIAYIFQGGPEPCAGC